jgi:hypothetical protein
MAQMESVREYAELPRWPGADAGALRLRPFGGRPEDIDFQFQRRRRLDLELELLTLCCQNEDGRAPDRETLLDLPVSARTEALLALAELADPRPLEWSFRCAAPECRCENEFELTFAELFQFADRTRAQPSAEAVVDDLRILLRRPTGRDQLEMERGAEGPATETMLQSVVVHPDPRELQHADVPIGRILAAVDAVMDDFDSLAAFELETICAGCGKPARTAAELGGAALDRLAREQARVLAEVHRLASRYHWTEEVILKLPPWRRRFYLDQIDDARWAP